jgi:glutamate racemase
VGGLTVHRELTRRFPDRDFVYLADQANAPYGGRNGEEIVDLTRLGCERLFAAGASIIVLACNTASAIALRRLQQTWVPDARARHGRPVNVLGIIVPTIEAATGLPWTYEAERIAPGDKVEAIDITGVFCTAATAMSRVYEIEIDKRREDLAVFSEPCPGLAGLIEHEATQQLAHGEGETVLAQRLFENVMHRQGLVLLHIHQANGARADQDGWQRVPPPLSPV